MLLLVSSSHVRDHSDAFKTARFTTILSSHATIFPYFFGTDFRTHPGVTQCWVFCKEDTYFPRAKRLHPVPRRAAPEYCHPRPWPGTGPATLRPLPAPLRMRSAGAKSVTSVHEHASLPPTLPPRSVRAAAGPVPQPVPCSPCPLPVLRPLSRGWGNSALGATSNVTWLGSQRGPARDRLTARRLRGLSRRGPQAVLRGRRLYLLRLSPARGRGAVRSGLSVAARSQCSGAPFAQAAGSAAQAGLVRGGIPA